MLRLELELWKNSAGHDPLDPTSRTNCGSCWQQTNSPWRSPYMSSNASRLLPQWWLAGSMDRWTAWSCTWQSKKKRTRSGCDVAGEFHSRKATSRWLTHGDRWLDAFQWQYRYYLHMYTCMQHPYSAYKWQSGDHFEEFGLCTVPPLLNHSEAIWFKYPTVLPLLNLARGQEHETSILVTSSTTVDVVLEWRSDLRLEF